MSTPRGQLGEGAVLSLIEAASALGIRETDAIRWLRAEGLVASLRLPPDEEHPEGRKVERVVWRRVLARLEAGEEPAPVPRAARGGLRRASTL